MWKVYVGPLFYGIVLNVISSFATLLMVKRDLDALLYLWFCCHMAVCVLCLLISCLELSAVFDCGISWSYSLVFCINPIQ